MAKSIEDFLVELDTNSKLLKAYKKDPVATAKKYGLPEDEVQIIADKKWDELSKRFDDTSKTIRVINYQSVSTSNEAFDQRFGMYYCDSNGTAQLCRG